jgi:hypothetical protein
MAEIKGVYKMDFKTGTLVPKVDYELEVNQIVWLNGYGQSECSHKRLAIYEIEKRKNFGTNYKCVCLDTFDLSTHSYIEPVEQLFGIGIYYNTGDIADAQEVQEALKKAIQKRIESDELKEKKRVEAEEKRARDIEIGRKVLPSIPEGATHIIVAELKKDESDIQTDYFNSTTEKVVYLAFSNHKKDLFSEMRKAADVFEPTKTYGVGKGIYRAVVVIDKTFQSNGSYYREGQQSFWHNALLPEKEFSTKAEVEEFIQKAGVPNTVSFDGETISFSWKINETEIEHREKWSMGAGYYLGESKYHGWIVCKEALGSRSLEHLQIAIAEGCFFIPLTDKKGTVKKELEEEKKDVENKVEAGDGKINIVVYSEKAIAVIGDTKPVKDKLKELGGKFNFRLTCGCGWIFPKTKLNEVKKSLGLE